MDSFFDSSRKKFVAATPEEAVRQAVVSWLKDVQKVPGHLIETEFALRLFDPRNAERVDILVHDFREGANAKEPWLLVECKRPGVESPAALQVQVNKYLRILKPKFIMLSLFSKFWALYYVLQISAEKCRYTNYIDFLVHLHF